MVSATAHMANNSLMTLEGVFHERIISCGLWPAYSLELNTCYFYLWGNLKNKVYRMNTHTKEELNENIYCTHFGSS
jgi:hypothetical protein